MTKAKPMTRISSYVAIPDGGVPLINYSINVATTGTYFVTTMTGSDTLFFHKSTKAFQPVSVNEYADAVAYMKDMFFETLDEAAQAVVEYDSVAAL